MWDFTLEGIGEYEGRAVTNRLRSELVNSGQFRVMSRDQIKKLLGEIELGQMLGDPRDAIEAGKLKGVDYVVTGTLVLVMGATQVTVEMIDGSTAEIMRSITPRPFQGDFLSFIDTQVPWLAAQVAGVAAAEQPPEVVREGPRWARNTGVALLLLALATQFQAWSVNEEAHSDADTARDRLDFQLYENSRDKLQDARNLQTLAILLGAGGAVMIAQYISPQPMTRRATWSDPAIPPLRVAALPGRIEVHYELRW
ncbi:MAG: hypothetical protein HY342_11505 [Candidatus Lambdaproteobacteria bacterium]|nr:hypothetical protein [Candidatus Lambdaproteobacteria bacterium]